jgi:hypothetical protein
MGPIDCLVMSTRNYHYILRNIPEKLRAHKLFLIIWEGIVFPALKKIHGGHKFEDDREVARKLITQYTAC